MLEFLDTQSLQFKPAPADATAGKLLCRQLLKDIGEDPSREGLQRTPERFHKAFLELTSGYQKTVAEVIGEGVFEGESNGPIVMNDIEFFSLCEHHLLPFWGKANIAYLPGEKILGLSKLARVVEVFARRLQVQERLTREIADAIRDAVGARAVVVSINASHMCMAMRGVGKPDAMTYTSYKTGFEKLTSEEKDSLLRNLK
jgi:GTP cyclohydrolase I